MKYFVIWDKKEVAWIASEDHPVKYSSYRQDAFSFPDGHEVLGYVRAFPHQFQIYRDRDHAKVGH